MADLIIFDIKKIHKSAQPLHNFGGTCYFNALMQALVSLSPIYNIDVNPYLTNYLKYQREEDAYRFLAMIHKHIGQESVRIVLCSILDKYPRLARLFTHRFRRIMICAQCKYESKSEDMNTIIDCFHIAPNTPFSGNDILLRIYPDADYKCDRCKNKGAICKLQLTMVPEIIVLAFRKYEGPARFLFPSALEIGNMKYQLISQIEHFGSLDSGHYIAKAVRGDNKVYLFDDTSIMPARLGPTDNVYLAFYVYFP